jgi:hypothetical protein
MATEFRTTAANTVRAYRTGESLSELGRELVLLSVTISSKLTHRSTGLGDPNRWRVVLRRPTAANKRGFVTLTTDYFMGNAHERDGMPIEPEAADVVSSLLLDASARQAGSFEAWADDFGYSADSRDAERTYRACLANADKLARFLSASAIERLQGLEH